MRTVHKAASFLVIALGTIHVLMTPVFFDQFTMRVMWFVAQGVMGIFLGLLNVVAWRAAWRDQVGARLCHLSNLIGTAFIVLYSTVDRAPQSFAAIALFAVLTSSGLVAARAPGPKEISGT
jgi:hypothetical protein